MTTTPGSPTSRRTPTSTGSSPLYVRKGRAGAGLSAGGGAFNPLAQPVRSPDVLIVPGPATPAGSLQMPALSPSGGSRSMPGSRSGSRSSSPTSLSTSVPSTGGDAGRGASSTRHPRGGRRTRRGGSVGAADEGGRVSPGEGGQASGKRTAVTLERSHPLYSRMKYYNRLTPSAESSHHFRAPQHIVWGGASPYALFVPSGEQGSFSTIFSIWNVMVGSGLLVMPWAFQNAGLVGGTLVLMAVGLLCFYTAAIIVDHSDGFDDFPDMVMRYFGSPRIGRLAYYFASWSSVLMLLCVLVVYLTMISDFTHAVVSSIVLWHSGESGLADLHSGEASRWFSLKTVPLMMGVVLFPFMNLRDIGPLVKFNSFGIVSILYMIGFIVTKSVTDLSTHPPVITYFSDKWYYLGGLGMVSFFIHNAIIPIIRNKKSPKHNRRDLAFAFGFVFLTYASCGIAGYLAFESTAIPQNFLNVYSYHDVTPFLARLALLIQLCGIFPLLAYIVRLQIFTIVLSPPEETEALLSAAGAADMTGASGGPELINESAPLLPDPEAPLPPAASSPALALMHGSGLHARPAELFRDAVSLLQHAFDLAASPDRTLSTPPTLPDRRHLASHTSPPLASSARSYARGAGSPSFYSSRNYG